MKKSLQQLTACLGLLAVSVMGRAQGTLSQQQLNDAVTNAFAIGESVHRDNLRDQNAALAETKQAFGALSNDNLDAALEHATTAITTYRRYAVPYLLCAYVMEQKNEPMQAYKYVVLYKKFRNNTANAELKSEVPASFEEHIISSAEAGFSRMTTAEKQTQVKQEGWLNNIVSINLISGYGISDSKDLFYSHAKDVYVPGGELLLNLGISYTRNIWFGRDTRFSNICANQYGAALTARYENERDLTGGDVYSYSVNRLILGGGLYLGRFYAGLDKGVVNALSDHPNGYSYISYGGTPVSYGAANSYTGFEMRYYLRFANGRGTNRFNRHPTIVGDRRYLPMDGFMFFRYTGTKAAGNSADNMEAYSTNKDQMEFGFAFCNSCRVNVALSSYYSENATDISTMDATAGYFKDYLSTPVVTFGTLLRIGVRVF